jgi:hypothetical protein
MLPAKALGVLDASPARGTMGGKGGAARARKPGSAADSRADDRADRGEREADHGAREKRRERLAAAGAK